MGSKRSILAWSTKLIENKFKDDEHFSSTNLLQIYLMLGKRAYTSKMKKYIYISIHIDIKVIDKTFHDLMLQI